MVKGRFAVSSVAGSLLVWSSSGCGGDAGKDFTGVALQSKSLVTDGAQMESTTDGAQVESGDVLPVDAFAVQTAAGPGTLVKYLDSAGDGHVGVRLSDGSIIGVDHVQDVILQGEEPIIADPLSDAMVLSKLAGQDLVFDVFVSMREPSDDTSPPREMLTGTASTVLLNGKEITQDQVRKLNADRASWLQARHLARVEKRADLLSELAKREGWNWNADIARQIADQGELVEAKLRASDVQRFVDANRDIVGAVDLNRHASSKTLSSWMNATWIEPYSGTGAHGLGLDGDGISVYMSELMCRSNASSEDPGFDYNHYYREAGVCNSDPSDPAVDSCEHHWLTSKVLQSVAPHADIFCRANNSSNVLPTSSDLAVVQITSTSAGETTCTTTYNSDDKAWDNLGWWNNLLVFQAVGNEGAGNGNVCSPAKGRNTIGVGNYVDNASPPSINTTSSWNGPLNTLNEKPELSAPGTNLDTYGFFPLPFGTSFSTPLAAGFAADLMEELPVLEYRPWLAKAWLMASATDPVSGGFSKVGMGGIDFYSAHDGGAWAEWVGAKSDWAYFDSVDPWPNNARIDTTVALSTTYSKVNVVVVWLTRPDFTYAHRGVPSSLGLDVDVTIYKPNGTVQASLQNLSSGFEHYTFTPTVSGTYRISMNHPGWDDNSNDLYMGLGVQWL